MILNLKDETSWEPLVRKTLNEILGPSYASIVIGNPDKIKYRDSEEEACNLFSHEISRDDLVEAVMQKVSKNFTEVIAYHGCRPEAVCNYYENGIMPLSPLEAQSKFRNLFSDYASLDEINKAIDFVSINTREGMVYTVLDDRVFYESSGHYLIYGGEYMYCLAVHLPGNREINGDILKKQGKATVFACKLPFLLMPDREELTRFMLSDHFFRIAHTRDEVFISHFGIVLNGKIHPKFIINHYC